MGVKVDITPAEFALWALGCIGIGVILGFPIGGITALRHFLPAYRLGDEAETYVRQVTGQ